MAKGYSGGGKRRQKEMMLAECQPHIWLPFPQQWRGGGMGLKPFVALTPRGFKGRAVGLNPPPGAKFCSGPGEKFLQWMELVSERLRVRIPRFHSVRHPHSWLNLSLPVPSQSIRGERQDWESHPIAETRAGGCPGFQSSLRDWKRQKARRVHRQLVNGNPVNRF